MKGILRIIPVCLAFALCISAQPAFAGPVKKCTKLQSKNYLLPGKCVDKTKSKAALKLFTTRTCDVCHGKTSSACTVDLGDGSCTYTKMAQLIKAANETAGNTKSVPPGILIDQFNTYSAFMPGIATPSAADAKKFITYISTVKQ